MSGGAGPIPQNDEDMRKEKEALDRKQKRQIAEAYKDEGKTMAGHADAPPTTEGLWDLIKALKDELNQIRQQAHQYQQGNQAVTGYPYNCYNIDVVAQDEIDKMFTYHPPHGDQANRYQVIRDTGRDMATVLYGLCPRSTELGEAIRSLNETVMWANAAIARNENQNPKSYPISPDYAPPSHSAGQASWGNG